MEDYYVIMPIISRRWHPVIKMQLKICVFIASDLWHPAHLRKEIAKVGDAAIRHVLQLKGVCIVSLYMI